MPLSNLLICYAVRSQQSGRVKVNSYLLRLGGLWAEVQEQLEISLSF